MLERHLLELDVGRLAGSVVQLEHKPTSVTGRDQKVAILAAERPQIAVQAVMQPQPWAQTVQASDGLGRVGHHRQPRYTLN